LIFKFPRHKRGEAALRREAAILSIVAPVVSLPVPQLRLHDRPLFSAHRKIAGDHLLAADYERLSEGSRARLGEALGRFYAQLHTIAPPSAAAAGAVAVETWLPADAIRDRIAPVLPAHLKDFAETVLAQWARLPPDPLGMVYGFFDGHGWNMAFDHDAGLLNGVFDFADSGIGPLHQEFIYSNLVSPDLTSRIIDAYEHHTSCLIDRDRVQLLTGVHRLWELAAEAHLPDHVPALVRSIESWAEQR
jgi:hypothetical protein